MADNLDINTIHKELAKNDFIVFAGAGVVSGTGIPNSWNKLLLALGKEVNFDIGLKDEYLIVKGDRKRKEEYPEIAQEIYEKLDRDNKKNRYFDIIKESVRATISPYSPQAFDILITVKCVVTTNFDNVFEVAYERLAEVKNLSQQISKLSLPDLDNQIGFDQYAIVYLHGRAKEHHIIFRSDDYKNYYPTFSNNPEGDRILENYLERIYSNPNRSIVFVGVSFDDIYLRSCLNGILQRLLNRDYQCSDKIGYREVVPRIRHYAFLPKVRHERNSSEGFKEMEIEAELEKLKIKVIRYVERRDWMDCFKRVREEKKTREKISI